MRASPVPGKPTRGASARAGAASRASLALALALVAAGAWVWWDALGTFFSQDDFAKLATTMGLAPRLTGAWRILGNQLAFDLLHHLAGLDPRPYHLASLAAHTGCALALAALLARRLSRAAAFAGGLFFLVHPAVFACLYWASTLADGLALLFALAALGALERRGMMRWLALPLFALSLLAKESTVLLPLAALLLAHAAPPHDAVRPAPSPSRDWPRLSLWALAAIYVVYFATSAYPTYFVPPTAAGATAAAPAYALARGGTLLWSFLTLTGWAVNFLLPTVRGFTDALDPSVYPWAIGAVLVWALGCRSRALRRNGWAAGGGLYLAFLLPVLPLAHHTYHYYLEAPLVGMAWCVAAAVETATARAASATRGLVVAALALGLTLNGWALTRKNENMPFLYPELRSDPIVDRARIAARARDGLIAAALTPGTRLAFWSPSLVSLAHSRPDSTRETYFEQNVRSALLDGLAVRVMFPVVDSVTFVRAYRPLPDPWRYAIYRLDGGLRVATSAEVEELLERFPAGR
jgi:hypothetical protein